MDQPILRRASAALPILALSLLLAGSTPAGAKDRKLKNLPTKYREWVEEVELLMTKEERKTFLEIREDRHRDAFIEGFWSARDPDPATRVNEFRERYYQRLETARERFPHEADERVRYFLLYGEPERMIATDCSDVTWPFETWRIFSDGRIRAPLVLIFYQPNKIGPYRLWRPADGHNRLFMNPPDPTAQLARQERQFIDMVVRGCRGAFKLDVEELVQDFGWVRRAGPLGPVRAAEPPPPRDPEWLATYLSASTQPAADAERLGATLEFRFAPGRGERVAVEGVVAVPAAQAEPATLGDRTSYNFLLNGEVLRQGELFETFRNRFDLPVEGSSDGTLSVVFERLLRPGEYVVVVRLEDLRSGRVFHAEREIDVPAPTAVTGGSR